MTIKTNQRHFKHQTHGKSTTQKDKITGKICRNSSFPWPHTQLRQQNSMPLFLAWKVHMKFVWC